METNTRDFTRSFPKFRRAALNGGPITVRDREGNQFVFMAKKKEPKTLYEAAAHLIGVCDTGIKKKPRGYAR
jgi:hypothetical protein